jgi:hypothetical protein
MQMAEHAPPVPPDERTHVAGFDFLLRIPNPFPGGGTFALINIYKFDDFEWYWRDYMDHYMGPWPSFDIARQDAEQTYSRAWREL